MNNKKQAEKKDKPKARWVLCCPRCFSVRNDLYMGGKYANQMYKCLNCEFIGTFFIEVEEETLQDLYLELWRKTPSP